MACPPSLTVTCCTGELIVARTESVSQECVADLRLWVVGRNVHEVGGGRFNLEPGWGCLIGPPVQDALGSLPLALGRRVGWAWIADSDRSQLASVAKDAKAALHTEKLDAVADRGYFNGEEILACEQAGITVTLPKPMTSGAKSEGHGGRLCWGF